MDTKSISGLFRERKKCGWCFVQPVVILLILFPYEKKGAAAMDSYFLLLRWSLVEQDPNQIYVHSSTPSPLLVRENGRFRSPHY